MKFTQKTTDAFELPPGRDDVVVFDDDIPGFGLRVRTGGARSYVFQYALGRKHRRLTLGRTTALRLDQAKATARELYARTRLGHDPAGERLERVANAADTFDAALKLYMVAAHSRLRSRTRMETERYLGRYLCPLHGLQLAKLDRRLIAEHLSRIASNHGVATANRARAALMAFLSWTMKEGLADQNPAIGTTQRPEPARSRVLSNDELRAIWRALPDTDYGRVVKLLVLTGQRRDEIGRLSWSEISDDRIVLPPERVKNKRMHVIPLTEPARQLLAAQPRRAGSDLVFGRRGEGGFGSWSLSKPALDDRIAEVNGQRLRPWVLHDVRRSVATGMADLGVAPHVIEAVLNHVSGTRAGIGAIYNRSSYEREKTAALALWGEHVMALVDGRASKVVPLRT